MDTSVVPVAFPSKSLFQRQHLARALPLCAACTISSFSLPLGLSTGCDIVCEGESLVPAAIVDPQNVHPCRRWRRERNHIGFRWQPEGGMSPKTFIPTASPLDESYTEQEYETHLQMPGWTREETDYLLELCRRFSYRFIVIADRYEFAADAQRTVEDLRERYYGVKSKLAALRSPASPLLVYNKEADRHYRLKLDALHRRPYTAGSEELFLSEMMSQLRLVLPRVVQEREKTLLLCCQGFGNHLLAHSPSLADLAGSRPRKHASNGSVADPVRGHHRHPKTDANKNPANRKSSLPASENKKRRPSLNGAETWSAAQAAASNLPGRKPKPVSCNTFARTLNLRTLRVGLTRHVDRMLLDMGLGVRPTLPTTAVCARFEELRSRMEKLSELQKTLATLQGSSSTPSATASVMGRAGASNSTGPSRRPSRSTSPHADPTAVAEKMEPLLKRPRRE